MKLFQRTRTPTPPPRPVSAVQPYGAVDVSLETPDGQFTALVQMIEANDAAYPSPKTTTPPYGETILQEEYLPASTEASNYLPAPDLEPMADHELLSVISDAYPVDIPEWDWYNDDQYYGLGVPPGIANVQPIESGHSQNVRPNSAAHAGEFAWSGKPWARVARHENNFPGYNAGQSRGHEKAVEKISREDQPARTQQTRDLLLAEIKRRGIHNVVLVDVPAESYTEQVVMIDPTTLAPQMEIGAEGVLP